MSIPSARLIPLMVASGSVQMAIDEWLLSRYNATEESMVLRFYQWEPAAISLGYAQQRWPAHWHAITWQGQSLPLVRRSTGGRGVLHQGDLCYALITAPVPDAPSSKPNRRETYHHLCRFLQQGWQDLGFPLVYGNDRPSSAENQRYSNCFALNTTADLRLSNGCKWIGSAQRWRSGTPEVVLQQGSMRLSPDPTLWQEVFGIPLPEVPLDPPLPSTETIVSALVKAATHCFQTRFIPKPLSETEWSSISVVPPGSPTQKRDGKRD